MLSLEFIRLIHVLSSALMFGVGVGAFWFVTTAATAREPAALAVVTRNAVGAELAIGVPVAIVQPLTGWLLMRQLGYSFNSAWFWSVVAVYMVTGIAWVYLVKSEFRLRALAAPMTAMDCVPELAAALGRVRQLAITTLAGVLVLFWLMVFRPGI